MRVRLLALALGALTLTIPLATAEWKGRGFYEPDTARDGAGFMHPDPDRDANAAVKKVYFSGYVGQAVPQVAVTSFNPNVALLGSQVHAYPTVVSALLGVWKDCNEDGYIGMSESAGSGLPVATGRTLAPGVANPGPRWDTGYPAALLGSSAICPSGGPYNDGTTVVEFKPIFPRRNAANTAYDWANDSTRVWADFGYSEEAATPTCPLDPQPRGTYQSTGGALRYVDCFTSWRIVGAVDFAADVAGLDGLSFDDAPRERPDQSTSPLNRPNPYGQPSASPMVSAYDCDAGQRVRVRDPTAPDDRSPGSLSDIDVDDPTGGQLSGPLGPGPTVTVFSADDKDFDIIDLDGSNNGTYRTVVVPRTAPVVNPGGSVAGSVNEAESGLGDCNTREPGNLCDGIIHVYRDVDQRTGGDVYCYLEGDHEGTTSKRSRTDHYFSPSWGNNACQGGCGDALWRSRVSITASRNPLVNRETLAPWGASAITFYAKLGTTEGLTLPSGSTATYGADHCDGATARPGGLWECDPAKWWLGPDGRSIRAADQVSVGTTYHLRDVDCYDFTVWREAPDVNLGSLGRACER